MKEKTKLCYTNLYSPFFPLIFASLFNSGSWIFLGFKKVFKWNLKLPVRFNRNAYQMVKELRKPPPSRRLPVAADNNVMRANQNSKVAGRTAKQWAESSAKPSGAADLGNNVLRVHHSKWPLSHCSHIVIWHTVTTKNIDYSPLNGQVTCGCILHHEQLSEVCLLSASMAYIIIPSLLLMQNWLIIKNGQSGSLPILIAVHYAFCIVQYNLQCRMHYSSMQQDRLWRSSMQHLHNVFSCEGSHFDLRGICGEIRLYGLALSETEEKPANFSQH